MNKLTLTNAVISQGFGNQPAIRFSEKGTGAHFKIGQRVYDPHAESHTRWLNLSVKAFGFLTERISKMGLKAGSCINLVGRLDEETWDDNGTTKRQFVIILDEIEYAHAAEKKPAEPPPAPAEDEAFTGFETFGGELY